MARDRVYTGSASQLTDLGDYLSGWAVAETAGAAAVVRIRDGFGALPACSLADGAAGNSTAGVHYAIATIVTCVGESTIGAYPVAAGFTSAGSKILNVTVPAYGTTSFSQGGAPRDVIIGRNVYLTKAGAPATLIVPTNAQWFLPVANPSTTLTSANNGLPLVAAGQSVGIVLTSATGFNAGPAWCAVTTDRGIFPVYYTSIVGSTLTGCFVSGATPGALMATSGAVTQAAVPDNSTTALAVNLADASLTATHPPTKHLAGSLIVPDIRIPAQTGGFTAGDSLGPNVIGLQNGGTVCIEVASGTVVWTVRGN
jgi:hypothetical protein